MGAVAERHSDDATRPHQGHLEWLSDKSAQNLLWMGMCTFWTIAAWISGCQIARSCNTWTIGTLRDQELWTMVEGTTVVCICCIQPWSMVENPIGHVSRYYTGCLFTMRSDSESGSWKEVNQQTIKRSAYIENGTNIYNDIQHYTPLNMIILVSYAPMLLILIILLTDTEMYSKKCSFIRKISFMVVSGLWSKWNENKLEFTRQGMKFRC